MITGRQPRNERGDLPRHRVHGHDARAVVLPSGVGRLIGVRREEPPSLKAAFERNVDPRPRCLEAAGLRGAAPGRLGQFADLYPVLVEYQDVGRERVIRIEGTTNFGRTLLVADARQAVSGLEHIHLELLRIAKERDPRRKFRPVAKTETLNPGGTTMSLPVSGLNNANSVGQIGFVTVAASPMAGNATKGAAATVAVKLLRRLRSEERRVGKECRS